MKAYLIFNLDDADDRVKHRRCMKVDDVYSVLTTFSDELERRIDYGQTDDFITALRTVHDLFYETLEKYDILLFDE